jgi:hemin uptake protein HemP
MQYQTRLDNFNTNHYRLYMSNDQMPFVRPETDEEKGAALPRRVDSAALFGVSRELIIVHNGRGYRLRMTQNEKLILTA